MRTSDLIQYIDIIFRNDDMHNEKLEITASIKGIKNYNAHCEIQDNKLRVQLKDDKVINMVQRLSVDVYTEVYIELKIPKNLLEECKEITMNVMDIFTDDPIRTKLFESRDNKITVKQFSDINKNYFINYKMLNLEEIRVGLRIRPLLTTYLISSEPEIIHEIIESKDEELFKQEYRYKSHILSFFNICCLFGTLDDIIQMNIIISDGIEKPIYYYKKDNDIERRYIDNSFIYDYLFNNGEYEKIKLLCELEIDKRFEKMSDSYSIFLNNKNIPIINNSEKSEKVIYKNTEKHDEIILYCKKFSLLDKTQNMNIVLNSEDKTALKELCYKIIEEIKDTQNIKMINDYGFPYIMQLIVCNIEMNDLIEFLELDIKVFLSPMRVQEMLNIEYPKERLMVLLNSTLFKRLFIVNTKKLSCNKIPDEKLENIVSQIKGGEGEKRNLGYYINFHEHTRIINDHLFNFQFYEEYMPLQQVLYELVDDECTDLKFKNEIDELNNEYCNLLHEFCKYANKTNFKYLLDSDIITSEMYYTVLENKNRRINSTAYMCAISLLLYSRDATKLCLFMNHKLFSNVMIELFEYCDKNPEITPTGNYTITGGMEMKKSNKNYNKECLEVIDEYRRSLNLV